MAFPVMFPVGFANLVVDKQKLEGFADSFCRKAVAAVTIWRFPLSGEKPLWR